MEAVARKRVPPTAEVNHAPTEDSVRRERWTVLASGRLEAAGVARNVERAFWWLFERCGNEPGRVTSAYAELVTAAGVSSEGAARRAVKKLEELGIARVDRDASRPGKLVVDVMRPMRGDPQQVFEFAQGPQPLPPDAPLRLQVAAAAEALPDRDPPRRPPRAPSTSTAPSTPAEHGPQPVGSLLAQYLQRVAPEYTHHEPNRARTLLSLSRSSQYSDPLTFSPSPSPSEKGALEGRAIESPPRSICAPAATSREGPGGRDSPLAQRILDRERELWRRVASPGLYRWVTVWAAYLIETGKVPESVIEDVAYSCKLTVQDGRTRTPGMVSPGQLFGRAIKQRLEELGHAWPTFPLMRQAFRAVGLVWQSHWDGGFKPGGKAR